MGSSGLAMHNADVFQTFITAFDMATISHFSAANKKSSTYTSRYPRTCSRSLLPSLTKINHRFSSPVLCASLAEPSSRLTEISFNREPRIPVQCPKPWGFSEPIQGSDQEPNLLILSQVEAFDRSWWRYHNSRH